MATNGCIVIDIESKLKSARQLASHGTIHKVPDSLMEGNKEDYTPRLVSIGPYHSRNKSELKYQFLQNLIDRNRSPKNSLKKYLDAVGRILRDAQGKYSSGDGICQNPDELVMMLVIDGCFIIELFVQRVLKDEHRPKNITRKELAFLHSDVLLVENQIPFVVLTELFKASDIPQLESHLEKVVKGNSPFTFTQLALEYFKHDELIGASAAKFHSENEFDHLLHLYHSIWDQSPNQKRPSEDHTQAQSRPSDQERPSEDHTQAQSQPSDQEDQASLGCTICSSDCLALFLFCWLIVLYLLVTKIWSGLKKLVRKLLDLLPIVLSILINIREGKLKSSLQSMKQPKPEATASGIPNARLGRDMGIKFSKNVNPESMLDISLTEGVLKIPVLPIHERTIIIFRNIVAFEELHPDTSKNFTAFATFMNMLIDTEEDVTILKKCGIIENQLENDQSVADFFNSLCKGTYLERDGHILVSLFDDLKNYDEKYPFDVMLYQWRQTLIPSYSRSAWAIPVIVVAVILLIPSALQTFNTIYSMFYPPSQQSQLISVY